MNCHHQIKYIRLDIKEQASHWKSLKTVSLQIHGSSCFQIYFSDVNSSSFLPFTGDLAAFGLDSENHTCIAVIPVKEEGAQTITY